MLICPGTVMVFVVVVGVGAVMTGVTGTVVGVVMPGPAVFTNGDTFGAGIVAQELTPRLAISQEPSGRPTLGLPPGVVGVVDVGVDGDIGGPLDPAPHIPDTPIVPIAEPIDIPPIGNVSGSVGATGGVETPDNCRLPDVAVLFVVAAMPAVEVVAVATDPIAIPPPS